MRKDDRVTSNERESFSENGYILPDHYYKGNMQMIDLIQDQLSDKGFIGFCKILIHKYLIRVEDSNNESKLRSYTKAAYYLNELINRRAKTSEPVSDERIKPHYYKKHEFDVLDVIEDQLEEEEVIGGYIGIILKQIYRAEYKHQLEDYKKAQFYLNKLIEYLRSKLDKKDQHN